MIWSPWKAYFEANARRPLPQVEAPALPQPQRVALARSLARFQLGEAGEGRIAHQIDQVFLPGVDADYRAALKLFVREEGRHARILGLMVSALGGRLLARSWTERFFVVGRRLLGVRFKLLVLLVAEVIGISFYGLLAAALPPGPLTAALEQMCADEEQHLRFHAQFFFTQQATPVAYLLLRLAWWPLGTCAALAVLLDHRHTLAALDVRLTAAGARLWARVTQAGRAMRAAPSRPAIVAAKRPIRPNA